MDFSSIITAVAQNIWGLPLLIGIFIASIVISLQLGFVQFRYFFSSISMLFASDEKTTSAQKTGELTSFQAFINTLGANIGNGSLGGIPVAICTGGPGAIFWLMVMSTFA